MKFMDLFRRGGLIRFDRRKHSVPIAVERRGGGCSEKPEDDENLQRFRERRERMERELDLLRQQNAHRHRWGH
jgi:hypothetical protein